MNNHLTYDYINFIKQLFLLVNVSYSVDEFPEEFKPELEIITNYVLKGTNKNSFLQQLNVLNNKLTVLNTVHSKEKYEVLKFIDILKSY